MANFLIVMDPDANRRRAFCTDVLARIAPLPGLAVAEAGAGDFQAIWARGTRAPVAQRAEEGSAAVIWGAPMTEAGRRVSPQDLSDRWIRAAPESPDSFDGYFAAAAYALPGRLVACADILGLFPVFWWQGGEVLLVGSSPELFKRHPLFRFELDLEGLTGILLTFHAIGGKGLMKGVKRLEPGHALVWEKGSPAREVLQYPVPASTRHFDLPGWAAAELAHDTLKDSVRRHLPETGEAALTLTGGRDSRLLAGIMVDLGRPPVAVTLGNPDDIEMQCAKAVARTLGLEHHGAQVPLDRDECYQEIHARWLHCSSGFNSAEYWHCHEVFREFAPFLVTGCIMGSIIGGALIGAAYSEQARTSSFETVFAKNNRTAIALPQLRRLLRPERFGSHVDDVLLQIRRKYESYSEFEAQRAFWYDIQHRQRLHVGALTWQFSFGSWPINPAVDKAVLGVIGGTPVGVLAEKRLHDEILRTYYPALAELPLDRNGYDTTPISPRLRHRLLAGLRARAAPATRLRGRLGLPERERRFYYRLLDFNGPAWKAARRRAEPHRAKLHDLFDRETLDTLLPGPEVDLPMEDGIIDGSAGRLLVGLCLWAGANL